MCNFYSIAVFLLLVIGTLFLPSACVYDNEEDLYGGSLTGCDTTNMRFSVEVKAIFDANCARCHVPGMPSYSGIPMNTHAQMEAFAKSGKLVNRINSTANPMPPSGLMATCDRARIEAWVRAGAPNN
ncbi:MAG: cytochrome c [Saprospiraceae bacterium]|nr:cytochrome c [Saprospiraceae bacterium]MDW8483277.1 cytochrome c [Saprospiraceae bacterium]